LITIAYVSIITGLFFVYESDEDKGDRNEAIAIGHLTKEQLVFYDVLTKNEGTITSCIWLSYVNNGEKSAERTLSFINRHDKYKNITEYFQYIEQYNTAINKDDTDDIKHKYDRLQYNLPDTIRRASILERTKDSGLCLVFGMLLLIICGHVKMTCPAHSRN